jgi:glycosyltransferase involved in cell wall biosynthesis
MTSELSIDVSVAIPCYNEEGNAEAIGQAVIEQLEPLGVSFEIIFIDNSSVDRTVEIIKRMCEADPRIKLIVNSRNFGQLRSPTHAIYQAKGAAIIGMCADFQDPPNLLPQFIERWRAGADIVLGVRKSEKSTMLLSVWRNLSYHVLGRIAGHYVIRNATGFGLYSRRVVDLLKEWNEPEPFFRSMLMETGLPVELVAYDRPERRAGISKNDFFTLLDFSLSAWSSSSRSLLRVPLFVSLLLLIFAIMTGVASMVSWILAGHGATLGWIAFIELHFAVLFFFLGLIADQVSLISERTRNAPLVIERERVNLGAPDESRYDRA